MVNNFISRATVFETNCQVDPNRIEEFFPYPSPTESDRLGRERCGKQFKRKSATIKTTTAKVATTIAALGVSCSLLYAMGDNLDYSHKFNAAVEQGTFGLPAAEPIAFLALSRELNLQTEAVSFDMSAAAPLSGQFKVAHCAG